MPVGYGDIEPDWDAFEKQHEYNEALAASAHEAGMGVLNDGLHVRRRGHTLLFRLRVPFEEVTMLTQCSLFNTTIGMEPWSASLGLDMVPCDMCAETGMLSISLCVVGEQGNLKQKSGRLVHFHARLCRLAEGHKAVFPEDPTLLFAASRIGYMVRFELETYF